MFEIIKLKHKGKQNPDPIITIGKSYIRFNKSCTKLIYNKLGFIPSFAQYYIDRETNELGVHFTQEPITQSKKVLPKKRIKDNQIIGLMTNITCKNYSEFDAIPHQLNAKFETLNGIQLLIGIGDQQ